MQASQPPSALQPAATPAAVDPAAAARAQRVRAENALDRLIRYVSPGRALRRLRERDLLARAYEGASPRDGWRPARPGASADTDHAADGTALRTRSRALVQNVPYIRRAIDSLVANVVGTGISPRSLAPRGKAVDALWAEWGAVADADGRLDIYGLQAAAYRAMEVDGEVLIRIRQRQPDDNLPVPVQLQLLEIDWLDSSRNETLPNGRVVIAGKEYDGIGRVRAYWLWPSHPGDTVTPRRALGKSVAVPAENIIHLYAPERPGQGRGFPRVAPVIARVRDLQLYEDAELQRKNLETRLSVLASGDASTMSGNEMQEANAVRATGELGTLLSGSVTQVPAGVNLTVVEPKAAGGYVEYVRFNLHLIAAGMGVTYPMMTGDNSQANFSSSRMGAMEFRRAAEQTQWLTLIPRLCAPIWAVFIDAAVRAGKLSAADYRVDWATPKWDYVNPEQDVKADLAEISGGLGSISEALRRRGYKPDLVFSEIKADFERLQADGTLPILMQLMTGKLAPPAAESAPT